MKDATLKIKFPFEPMSFDLDDLVLRHIQNISSLGTVGAISRLLRWGHTRGARSKEVPQSGAFVPATGNALCVLTYSTRQTLCLTTPLQ